MKQALFIFFLFIIIIVGNQREQMAIDLSPYVDMDDLIVIWPDGIYFADWNNNAYWVEIKMRPNIVYYTQQKANTNIVFLAESL